MYIQTKLHLYLLKWSSDRSCSADISTAVTSMPIRWHPRLDREQGSNENIDNQLNGMTNLNRGSNTGYHTKTITFSTDQWWI